MRLTPGLGTVPVKSPCFAFNILISKLRLNCAIVRVEMGHAGRSARSDGSRGIVCVEGMFVSHDRFKGMENNTSVRLLANIVHIHLCRLLQPTGIWFQRCRAP